MKLVVIESPYAMQPHELGAPLWNVERHLRYLRACMRDCLIRGESPFASHGLYTQPGVLCDEIPEERALGIEAGFQWRKVADLTVVYTDCGISTGMKYGIEDAEKHGRPVEFRELGSSWNQDEGLATRKWTNDA